MLISIFEYNADFIYFIPYFIIWVFFFLQ